MKKILMMLAVAACAADAMAETSAGMGYQLKWDSAVQAVRDWKYVTVYSMSSETLETLTGISAPTWADKQAVQDWLTCCQAYSTQFKKNATAWTGYTLSDWLTAATSENQYLTARTPVGGDYSIEANQWIVAFYDNPDDDASQLRIAYPIWGETDKAVTAVDGNAQNLKTGSFVVRGSKSSEFGQWTDIADIPEPTSGMLLLLGVAGLALKRKRA